MPRALSVLVAAVALASGVPAGAQIRPSPGSLDRARPELRARLRNDPYAYFRFVNRPWIARVCAVFADVTPPLPPVRLHGDAHVEQYALTDTAYGLDDFDDTSRGPAFVDIVRFLGSVDLALRARGWTDHRDALFDRFFASYRKGLIDPDAHSAAPALVRDMRAQSEPSRRAFLAWGDAQMDPLSARALRAMNHALRIIGPAVHAEQPHLEAGYFTVVRAGWLRMGIGSAETRKLLIRIQGNSPAPDDDELIEAKRPDDLGHLPCIETATSATPALRIVAGTMTLGRLRPHIVLAGPDVPVPEWGNREGALRNWWVKSWEPSYRELSLADFRSTDDLAEIVSDAALQLGAGGLREEPGERAAALRREIAARIDGLEPRIRAATATLVDELLAGWRELAETR